MKIGFTVAIYFALLLGNNAIADTLSGTITFLKKPPLAGLLYTQETNAPNKSDSLDQNNRKFTKDILVMSSGAEIEFNNSDKVDHNIYANDPTTNAKFDVGLMPTGRQVKQSFTWPVGSMIRIGCKIHPKMKSYIVTIDSPHYQAFEFKRSADPYAVSLSDIPAEKNDFKLVIPKYDPLSFTLVKGETKSFPLVKKGKEKGTLTITRE